MFKILKYLFSGILLLTFVQCKKVDDTVIIGSYQFDKHVAVNKVNDINTQGLLNLYKDGTFTWEDKTLKEHFNGEWEITDSGYRKRSVGIQPEATLIFTFGGKKISGEFRAGIIYFDKGNDFYRGKFKSSLYVSTSK